MEVLAATQTPTDKQWFQGTADAGAWPGQGEAGGGEEGGGEGKLPRVAQVPLVGWAGVGWEGWGDCCQGRGREEGRGKWQKAKRVEEQKGGAPTSSLSHSFALLSGEGPATWS